MKPAARGLRRTGMRTQLRSTAVRCTAVRCTAVRCTAVRIAAGVTAAGLLAAGCGSARAPRQAPRAPARHGVTTAIPAANPGAYGAADTAFGLDLLSAWCRQDPQANIVFSPASLATGLGMAYLGARGATAQAMASVLHLPAAGHELLAGLQARSKALHGLDEPGVTVASSDQVWADPSLITLRGYLDDIATGYGASAAVRQVPLLSQPARAASDINAAIAAATRGHIAHLLSAADLGDIGWVLTDALYLKASWATPFQDFATAPGSFTTAAGSKVSAHFLNGDGYVSDQADGWTAVSLPYRGHQVSMTALLPDSAAGGCPALTPPALASITRALANGARAHGKLAGQGGVPTKAWGGGGVSTGTAVSLPKVSVRSQTRLNGLLSQLGMGIAFGTAADFTGLSPQAAKLGFVIHAATLQVSEKGTVASAATAVGAMPTSLQVPMRTVSFNRPYLLVVTSDATGEPLFLARVANPLAS
jgi:serpin B